MAICLAFCLDATHASRRVTMSALDCEVYHPRRERRQRNQTAGCLIGVLAALAALAAVADDTVAVAADLAIACATSANAAIAAAAAPAASARLGGGCLLSALVGLSFVCLRGVVCWAQL